MDAAAGDAANDGGDPQSPPPSPPPAAVTLAASPLPQPQTLTLALPIQRQPSPASGSAGGGGGREDSWSEGATSALIEAWGERYLELGRGSLRQEHWREVAAAVSARDGGAKPAKSDAQCKNRIDTLKKKYKSEKSKISAGGGGGSSAWPFFHRLDILIGPTLLKPPSAAAAARAFPPQFPQRTRTQTVSNHTKASRPRTPPPARASPPAAERGAAGELARAVARLGEAYERVERAKAQAAAEAERQRMGFVREMELQRMQFFVKTQMELSRLSGGGRPTKRKRAGGDRRRQQQGAENGNKSA